MKWNGGNVRLELIMDDPHDREWKAMLTRKRVARYPISFSLLQRFWTASVLPLRTTWFGELIFPMWTSSRP